MTVSDVHVAKPWALCVGRSSVVGPKAPHEVSPTVQKGNGLGTTRGTPVV